MEQSSSTMSTLPPNTNTSGDKPCLACEPHTRIMNAEENRLEESRRRKVHWKRWGPYLSERQWAAERRKMRVSRREISAAASQSDGKAPPLRRTQKISERSLLVRPHLLLRVLPWETTGRGSGQAIRPDGRDSWPSSLRRVAG